MKEYKYDCPKLSLVMEKSGFKGAQIKRSADSAEYARQFYQSDIEIYESFFIIILNRANNTTGWVKISQGGITGTVADPRIIAHYAIQHLACSIVMVHNHPSGNLKPSRQDEELTQKIKQALGYFDINVMDHIILTSDAYYSFADEGLL